MNNRRRFVVPAVVLGLTAVMFSLMTVRLAIVEAQDAPAAAYILEGVGQVKVPVLPCPFKGGYRHRIFLPSLEGGVPVDHCPDGDRGVYFYAEPYYTAPCLFTAGNVASFAGTEVQHPMSITAIRGNEWFVTLYAEENFQGERYDLAPPDREDLSQLFGGQGAKSARVRLRESAPPLP